MDLRSFPALALPLLLAVACGGGSTPPTAPAISNLHLTPRRLYPSQAPVAFTVTFDFSDPNGDVASAKFVVTDGGNHVVVEQTIPVSASGITASLVNGAANVSMPTVGVYTLSIFLTDAAGLRSNVLTDTIEVSPHPWTELAAHPLPLQYAAAVSLGNLIYVLGGSRQDLGLFPGPCTNLVGAYDAATDAWFATPVLPTARYGIAAAAANGHIYAIGGSSGPLNLPLTVPVAVVEEFDPTSQVWSTKAPMPTARTQAAAVVLDGRIVIVGGEGPAGALLTVESYDPIANAWTTLPPMPHARSHPLAVALGGRILVVGGRAGLGSACVTGMDVFDPATGQWSTTAGPGCGAGLVEVGGALYWVGNQLLGRPDLAPDNWPQLTPAPRSFDERDATAVLGGRLYVLSQTSWQRYDPALELR